MDSRILWVPGFYEFPNFMDSRISWVPGFYGFPYFMGGGAEGPQPAKRACLPQGLA